MDLSTSVKDTLYKLHTPEICDPRWPNNAVEGVSDGPGGLIDQQDAGELLSMVDNSTEAVMDESQSDCMRPLVPDADLLSSITEQIAKLRTSVTRFQQVKPLQCPSL